MSKFVTYGRERGLNIKNSRVVLIFFFNIVSFYETKIHC